MRLPTIDNDALKKYYAMLKVTPERDLNQTWEEITEKDFMYWANVGLPAKISDRLESFATCEPTCDGPDGTIHETCVMVNGRYFRRPATIELFDEQSYIAQVKRQFNLT